MNLTIFLPSVSISLMLKIRLQRVGRKHEPTFRLVLTDSKNSTKSGRYLENLGSYDNRHGEASTFKTDRVSYWMSKGAQVSATVHNLLVTKNVISGKKINNLPLKNAIVKEQAEVPAEKPAEAAPVEAPKEEVAETPAEAPAPAEEVKEETPAEATA